MKVFWSRVILRHMKTLILIFSIFSMSLTSYASIHGCNFSPLEISSSELSQGIREHIYGRYSGPARNEMMRQLNETISFMRLNRFGTSTLDRQILIRYMGLVSLTRVSTQTPQTRVRSVWGNDFNESVPIHPGYRVVGERVVFDDNNVAHISYIFHRIVTFDQVGKEQLLAQLETAIDIAYEARERMNEYLEEQSFREVQALESQGTHVDIGGHLTINEAFSRAVSQN